MRSATLLALLPLAMAAPSVVTKRDSPAPLVAPRGASLVDGKYIIKFKNQVGISSVDSAMSSLSSKADYVYKNHFSGFAGSLTPEELENLRNDPNVEYIEQDAIIKKYATQNDATWGIARLSSQEPGGSTYTYDDTAGEGTCAYVVDTGIDTEHPDFEGRAEWLENFADNDDSDGDGHGTHVAGTIGSKTYGVAKKTKLFAVKVLDANGEGTTSGVIGGMDFTVENAAQQDCPKGVVVNMSLGGGFAQTINDAAAGIVDAGLFLAVAAGNEGVDAENSSPASEPSACTVGATEKDDSLASYSNFGQIVDILAPGSDIESTWVGGETEIISGTSMASPHVAGLAAYLLGLGGDAPTEPKELCAYIAETGLDGVISGVPDDTINSLANNGAGGSNSTALFTKRF